jgi:hypothetical protein
MLAAGLVIVKVRLVVPFRGIVAAPNAFVIVAAAITVCVIACDVLAVKFASAPYAAVIECEPAVSVEVLNVAVSGLEPLSVPVPIAVPPSLKVTVPLGSGVVPATCGATVAVNVTNCPVVDGLAEEVTVVVVVAWVTVCVRAVDVLVPKFVSPLYTAVIESEPTGSGDAAVVVNVAVSGLPPLSVPVPMVVAPFLNVTVPVGVPPAVLLTVAVNVTACPNADGFSEDVTVVVVGFTTTSVGLAGCPD